MLGVKSELHSEPHDEHNLLFFRQLCFRSDSHSARLKCRLDSLPLLPIAVIHLVEQRGIIRGLIHSDMTPRPRKAELICGSDLHGFVLTMALVIFLPSAS